MSTINKLPSVERTEIIEELDSIFQEPKRQKLSTDFADSTSQFSIDTRDEVTVTNQSELWTSNNNICESSFGRVMENNKIVNNGHLPCDNPEIFKNHPFYSGIEVSTLGRMRRDKQIFHAGKSHEVRLREAGRVKCGEIRKVHKPTLIAETFLGPKPSIHHSASILDPSIELSLSNLVWKARGQVLDFSVMAEEEILKWKPMPAPYSKYMYSTSGQLCRDGKVLKPSMNPSGYLKVTISNDSGIQETKKLHTLIAFGEYGIRPDGYDIAHLDNNKLNCCPSNLQYQSKSQNIRQAVREYTQHVQATSDDGKIMQFDSMNQAAKHFGINSGRMFCLCKSKKSVSLQNQTWRFEHLGQPNKKRQQQQAAPKNRCDWFRSDSDLVRGYEFTPDGLVRRHESDLLLTTSDLGGYKKIRLNGRMVELHLAMLEVFYGSRPSSNHMGDHIDENKLHNCRSNLQWTKKNVERSLGRQCERFKDGTWERFGSIRSAAKCLLNEQVVSSTSELENNAKGKRSKRYCDTIRIALDHSDRTAGSYKWRSLRRSPDNTYTCEDCKQIFGKRGDWVTR